MAEVLAGLELRRSRQVFHRQENLHVRWRGGTFIGMESMRLKIGEVSTDFSRLSVALSINSDGVGTVHVSCSELKKDRSGYLILTGPLWADLKELISRADERIDQLKKTGQLKYVAEGFRLVGE